MSVIRPSCAGAEMGDAEAQDACYKTNHYAPGDVEDVQNGAGAAVDVHGVHDAMGWSGCIHLSA